MRHTPANAALTPSCLLTHPSSHSVVGQPANRRGSRSPRRTMCWPPVLGVVKIPPAGAALRRRWRGSSLASASRRRRASADGHRAQHADDPLHLSRHEGARYFKVGWGADEAVQLAEVLPLCTSATALNLGYNKISARGAKTARRLPRARCRARETLPQKQPDWRQGRGGPRRRLGRARCRSSRTLPHGNHIGDEAVALAEAVGRARCRRAHDTLPRRQQAFSDGRGRGKAVQSQEERAGV